jgi:hypothetical protein
MHFVMMLIVKELIVGLLEPTSKCSILSSLLLLDLESKYFLLVRFNNVGESSGESQLALQSQINQWLTIILAILLLNQLICAELQRTTTVTEQFFAGAPVDLVQ